VSVPGPVLTPSSGRPARSMPGAFLAGAAVGVLGGLIGLGGAEFRLRLLIGVFGFAALAAVIMNKAISLIAVLSRCRHGWCRCPGRRCRRTGL
jgi:hypothetical protein